jgi:hypothetical protein
VRKAILAVGIVVAFLFTGMPTAEAATSHLGTSSPNPQCVGSECAHFSVFLFWDDVARTVKGVVNIWCTNNSGTHACDAVAGINVKLEQFPGATNTGTPTIVANANNGACGAAIGHTPCPNGVIGFGTPGFNVGTSRHAYFAQGNVVTVCFTGNNCNTEFLPWNSFNATLP